MLKSTRELLQIQAPLGFTLLATDFTYMCNLCYKISYDRWMSICQSGSGELGVPFESPAKMKIFY